MESFLYINQYSVRDVERYTSSQFISLILKHTFLCYCTLVQLYLCIGLFILLLLCSRGPSRNREDIRAGTHFAACSPRLRHHQPSVATAQNFPRAHRCVCQDFLS